MVRFKTENFSIMMNKWLEVGLKEIRPDHRANRKTLDTRLEGSSMRPLAIKES